MARCHQCGGTGEVELAVYRELDRLWNAGWGWVMDSSFLSDFWAERGYNPDNPPARYSVCNACGGTGDAPGTHENPALEARALAAWRAAGNSLVDRLVALHQKNRELALKLAFHTERYHGDHTPPGEHWPYQWLMADVAAWPVVREPSRLRIAYPDMPPDRTLCPVCGGWGRVEPRDVGESLADGLEKYPELGVEELLEEIPCPTCGGRGEVSEAESFLSGRGRCRCHARGF